MRKKKVKKLRKNDMISSLIQIDFKDDFIKINNKYCLLLKIAGIDIFNYSDEDRDSACKNFALATASLQGVEHKYIITDSKPILSENKKYVLAKSEMTDNAFHKYLLNRQYELFDYFEESHYDRLAFLIIFSDNADELNQSANNFMKRMRYVDISICDEKETQEFLAKQLKFTETVDDVYAKSTEFGISYIKLDDKYVTSLVAKEFRPYILDLTLASIFHNDLFKATTTLDVKFRNKTDVLDELSKSLEELKSRTNIGLSAGEESLSVEEFGDLNELFISLQRESEQMLSTTLRFYVSADTEKELSEKVKTFISDMAVNEGVELFIPQLDMHNEYKALVSPSDIIHTPMPLQGTFAKQFPFYYQSHIDKYGLYFGRTITGGNVILDTFRKTGTRNSYDIILVGVKGSGKSVALKAMSADALIRGFKVMVIDIEGEFLEMAKIHGGIVIRAGATPLINPLELRQTIFSEFEDIEAKDEISTNYAMEISRIVTFMYQYIPSITDIEMEEFKDVLNTVYRNFNITSRTDLSKLRPKNFPIFSDVLAEIRNVLYKEYHSKSINKFNENLTDRRKDILEKLEVSIKQLCEGTYASLFNGHSRLNVEDSNFIVFDVKAISEMEERVSNAQMFNILTTMWSITCDNIAKNRYATDLTRQYVVSVIDEAHRFINAKNIQATDYIERLIRRARKYFASLWFASQSILDFNPSDSETVGKDKIKTIFSLVQYKMLLKQSYDSIDFLQESFPNFTLSELKSTTEFEAGEVLISLGGDNNQKLHCFRDVPEEDMAYMGNSLDKKEVSVSQ